MRCETCHGIKTPGIPCPDCGGSGVANCCEGLRAQAEPEIKDECPNCHADMTGAPILAHHQHHYGNRTHFRRVISIYDLTGDCHHCWKCPDCGHEWQ